MKFLKDVIMRRKDVLIVIGIVCASIPLILPFFESGYFPTHDGQWAVVRLADMFRSLRDFQFPVRYSGALNFGYGYPLFNFAYPGPYYIGMIPYALTGSFITSVKILFAFSVPLSGLSMYLASRKLWRSELAGVISSIVYMYLPYRMVDLYVRGSLGESLSFVLFPLILYGGIVLFEKKRQSVTIGFVSICIALLILTHNIMTVLFLPIFTFFMLFKIFYEKRRDLIKPFITILVLALGMSSFFWIPALYEKHYIALSQIPIAERDLYFVTLSQVLIPSWGYNPPTEDGGFSYQLGLAQIIVLISAAVYITVTFFKKQKREKRFTTIVLLFVFWLILFTMMFPQTSLIWENTPLLREINYPWTLLSQLGLIGGFLAGGVIISVGKVRYMFAFAILLVSLTTLQYAKPFEYSDRTDEFYLTNEATTTSSDELMPLWVDEKPSSHFSEKVIMREKTGDIQNISHNSKEIVFDYYLPEGTSSTIIIHTIYYPGWNVFVDGMQAEIDYANERGIITFVGEAGNHSVRAIFTETPLRIASNSISIVSVVFILFVIFQGKRRTWKK